MDLYDKRCFLWHTPVGFLSNYNQKLKRRSCIYNIMESWEILNEACSYTSSSRCRLTYFGLGGIRWRWMIRQCIGNILLSAPIWGRVTKFLEILEASLSWVHSEKLTPQPWNGASFLNKSWDNIRHRESREPGPTKQMKSQTTTKYVLL